MTSPNQHYSYNNDDDDDEHHHHHQQLEQHHYANSPRHHDLNSPYNNNNLHNSPIYQENNKSIYCQAFFSNETCNDACQSMSAINEAAMCGASVWDTSHNLSRFHNYFNLNAEDDDDDDGLAHDGDGDLNGGVYLYSPGAPVGPSSCEYCGMRNIEDCPSNLPKEYLNYMGGGNGNGNGMMMDNNGNGGLDRNSNHANALLLGNALIMNHKHDMTTHDTNRTTTTNTSQDPPVDNKKEEEVCHRPKLFFLKKRPPFATPDGWDPKTEYRSNLFEPPSSVEGMGRGWGEVRGHLGSGTNNNNASFNNGSSLNRSYANNSGCGSSACGGAAETEISFSSAGGGTNVSASDGGSRSLSPVQWVSGLMGALSPS